MKTPFKILTLAILMSLSTAGFAQQPPMEHGMGGGMDPAKMTEHLKQKQAHMLMMHDLSNQILAEKDPQKQQALKDQQLELMKAHHMEMMSMHHGKPMEPGKPMDHKKLQH